MFRSKSFVHFYNRFNYIGSISDWVLIFFLSNPIFKMSIPNNNINNLAKLILKKNKKYT